jgi:hypothetical protein
LRKGRKDFADLPLAIAADGGDFTGDHDIGGALDAVNQRFAAAAQVINLICNRVVNIGNNVPLATISYRRNTPVVVSSNAFIGINSGCLHAS